MIQTIALMLLVFVGSAEAANTWAVGVNTLFIQEYAESLGVPCPGCPTNSEPHTLADIQATLLDLAANQHVGAFREIVPFQLLSPNGTNNPTGGAVPPDTTNYAVIDAVMNLYRAYNLHLVLAIGNPVPAWAAPWGNAYACFIPTASDTTNFNTFKNNISWTVGNYLNHLRQNGYGSWMAGGPNSPTSGGLFVEGFNEWNGNANYTNCADLSVATPQRAALIQGGISWVANYYGVTVNMAAPSVVFPPQGLANWYTAYYAAGGVGAPNVHIYGNGTQNPAGATAAITYAKNQLHSLINALGSPYNRQVIWGETGFGEAVNGCTGVSSMNSTGWAVYDQKAARAVTGGDASITQAVQLLTVWRLDRLTSFPALPCEATYGIVSPDLRTYLSAGVNMFRYLGGTGLSR